MSGSRSSLGPASALRTVHHALYRARERAAMNAFITLAPDRARRAALRAERRRANGTLDALFGWTVAVKDLIEVAGLPTTAGSNRSAIGRRDAPVVGRVERAGAIAVGKTNMDEWGLGVSGRNETWGDCNNPWSSEHLAGGSSSGSAVAVSAGITRIALGTDTAGSLRIPASFCGVTALKPTLGRVAQGGVIGLAPSLDSIGPIARTAADCGLAFAAIADIPVEHADPPHRARVGIPTGVHWQDLEVEVGRAVADAGRALESAGHRLVDIEVPAIGEATRLSGVVLLYELAHRHGYRWRRERRNVGPRAARQLDLASRITGREYKGALAFRDAWRARLAALLSGVDVLLHATTPTVAPPAGGRLRTAEVNRLCAAWNLAGLPVLALPCGVGRAGLPVGASLVGNGGRDELLLAMGVAYQALTDWHLRRPPTP